MPSPALFGLVLDSRITDARKLQGAMMTERKSEVGEAMDRQVTALLDDCKRLTRERDQARSVLSEIVDLYPYLNCACGRNKFRMSGRLREEALKVLGRSSEDRTGVDEP